MSASRKPDTYQTNNVQAMYGNGSAECKNVITHETLNTTKPWNRLLHTTHTVNTASKNINTKSNCAEIVDGDYIWVIEDSIERVKTEPLRLASAEIESVLITHPHVRDVAVIGLPHEQKGNEIHAFVVLKEDTLADQNIKHVLQEMVNTKIGSVAVPKFIEFIDYLTKTASGKLMRKALKAQALEQKLMLLN